MYEILVKNLSKNRFISSFIVTFVVVLISHLFAKNLNETCSGIIVLTLSLIPLVQILSKQMEIEEIKEEKMVEKNILLRHKDFIITYFGIFFGAVLSYYIAFLFFPEIIFANQIKAVEGIKLEVSKITASAINKEAMFSYILINNLKVLLLTLVLSFVFGAGAIYIILWNASIVGVFLGLKAKQCKGNILMKYVGYPMMSLIKILPHGILEFFSYFLSALSGGLIALLLIKGNTKHTQRILIDSIILFVSSIILLVVAAFIEAYL